MSWRGRRAISAVTVLLPSIWQGEGALYNAVLMCRDGAIVDYRAKHDLPNDDVFYEKRYFTAGDLPTPFEIDGVKVGRADLRGYLAATCIEIAGRRRC